MSRTTKDIYLDDARPNTTEVHPQEVPSMGNAPTSVIKLRP